MKKKEGKEKLIMRKRSGIKNYYNNHSNNSRKSKHIQMQPC